MDADTATCAVFGRRLDSQLQTSKLLAFPVHGLERRRRFRQKLRVVYLHPDRSVRAYQRAFGTLNAKVRLPGWNLQRNVAFFPTGCVRWKRPIDREGTHRQHVAATRNDGSCDILNESWRSCSHCGWTLQMAADQMGYGHLGQILQ